MRRTEIANSIEKVLKALRESTLIEAMQSLLQKRSSEQKETSANLLNALRQFSLLSRDFGPAEREILNILGLDGLEKTQTWHALLSEGDDPSIAHTIYYNLRFAVAHLPKLFELFETDASRAAKRIGETPSEKEVARGFMSVVLIEEPNQLSRPDRLITALESVSLLYGVSAELLGYRAETLSIIGCDSGSDKEFDFLGIASVMKDVKDVILSLWDRIVFFQEKKVETRIDLILKSLPILERIDELGQEKKIAPEQAELLRRNVLLGCTKFMDSGAIIPEIQSHTTHNPRLLMRPQPKLLAAGTDGDDEEVVAEERSTETEDPSQGKPDSVDTSILTLEENETLKSLLGKVEKKKSPRKKKK